MSGPWFGTVTRQDSLVGKEKQAENFPLGERFSVKGQ